MRCCGPVPRSLRDAGPRTRDSRPRPPSVCRLAVCPPPGPGHQFVRIRAGQAPSSDRTSRGVITSICPLPFYSHHPLLMSPETSWRLPTNHKSLSNPLLCSRTNCLQSVDIGQAPSPPEKTNWVCKAANSKHQRNQFRNWQ